MNDHEAQSFVSDMKQIILEIVKGVFGLLRIALIFVGVLVCLIVGSPLAPFISLYFIIDRIKTHKERMNGVRKKKEPMIPISEWIKGAKNGIRKES